MHALDNPIWQALIGPQARFAEGNGLARRFQPSLLPFAGLADESPGAYGQLRELVVDQGSTALFLPEPAQAGTGWQVTRQMQMGQLWCQEPQLVPAPEVELLEPDDLPAALELTRRTQPGPFLSRAFELGRYLGVKQAGTLVAMAGERLYPAGYCEVSAVCTDPAFQGRGLARQLVSEVSRGILARGETPFLHVMNGNASAWRAYEAIGFSLRREMTVTVLKAEY